MASGGQEEGLIKALEQKQLNAIKKKEVVDYHFVCQLEQMSSSAVIIIDVMMAMKSNKSNPNRLSAWSSHMAYNIYHLLCIHHISFPSHRFRVFQIVVVVVSVSSRSRSRTRAHTLLFNLPFVSTYICTTSKCIFIHSETTLRSVAALRWWWQVQMTSVGILYFFFLFDFSFVMNALARRRWITTTKINVGINN